MTERRAYLIMLVSIPILWTAAVEISGFPSFLLPPPTLVGRVLWEEAGQFAYHTSVTLVEALVGYTLANVVALTLAVSFLYLPWLEALLVPWTVVIKNIPFVSIGAILIITLGDSPVPKILLIIVICFFTLLANLNKGFKSADQVLLDRMKVLNASQWQILCKVRWPSALPYYIAAHEISFTGSIIGAIVVEWMYPRRGLGFIITRSLSQYRADKLWGVTIISTLLSVGTFLLVKFLEKRLFRWKEGITST